LIEQTGILRTTQIICDLNLERDREQSTFESVLARWPTRAAVPPPSPACCCIAR
jgi:hypothetical protein